jgi:amino acid permease
LISTVIFATGVLSIPTAMFSLGALGGALSVIGWGALNTYTAVVQGNFRNSHPGCHSIADMSEVLGGVVLKELVGALFLIAYGS